MGVREDTRNEISPTYLQYAYPLLCALVARHQSQLYLSPRHSCNIHPFKAGRDTRVDPIPIDMPIDVYVQLSGPRVALVHGCKGKPVVKEHADDKTRQSGERWYFCLEDKRSKPY